jgi:hypothetical protein
MTDFRGLKSPAKVSRRCRGEEKAHWQNTQPALSRLSWTFLDFSRPPSSMRN